MPEIVYLTKEIIKTPVTSLNARKRERVLNKRGVHQGLATANILAEIFLSDFDKEMKAIDGIFYFRYVDDILLLSNEQNIDQGHNEALYYLSKRLKLPINKEKTRVGRIENGFSYLGYKFGSNRASVRRDSIDKYISSIIALFTKYKYKKIKNEDLSVDILIQDVNFKITGAFTENKKYGWIAYFSQITDVQLLFSLEKTILDVARRYGLSMADVSRLKRPIRHIMR